MRLVAQLPRRLLLAVLLAGLGMAPGPVRPRPAYAAEPVDVALVLVSDVSRSIDDSEFRLEKDGYAGAFSDPKVIQAIRSGPSGAIAVAYVEFAGEQETTTVLDWTMLRDDASIHAFVTRLQAAPRSARGRTAIGAGVERALDLLSRSDIEAQRRVIDVAGDGTNNAGIPATEPRSRALAAGITINGLAIINDHPVSWVYAHTQPPGGLDNYYRENVAGGPGSFVLAVHDLHAFGEAMTRKLISEIAALPRPAPARG